MTKDADPFHVTGPDGITRCLSEHYDGPIDVEDDAYGAWLAIQNQAQLINSQREALIECQEEIDRYIMLEYPADHPVHERYRKRDFSANPARIALAAEDTQ